MPLAPVLDRVERYYDAVPRAVGTSEEVGPFTSFGPGEVATWTFYARPRLGVEGPFTAEDVRRVLARRREQGLPWAIEWVEEVTPSLGAAVVGAVGQSAGRYPLLVRRPDPAPPPQERVVVMTPGHPDLAAVVASTAAAFAGSDAAEAAPLTAQPRLIADGLLLMVAAYDAAGRVVGGGSASPRDGVAELMGVGVLPRDRHDGLGTAITQELVRAALGAGVRTLFLSAGSDGAASIYRRVGFEDVGTARILEPGDD